MIDDKDVNAKFNSLMVSFTCLEEEIKHLQEVVYSLNLAINQLKFDENQKEIMTHIKDAIANHVREPHPKEIVFNKE